MARHGAGEVSRPHTPSETQTAEAQNELSDMEESSTESPATQGQAADRGKWAVLSPIQSPTKPPSAKKMHGAANLGSQADKGIDSHEALTAFPASDAPATESTLKAMLLSLQTGLQRELRSSISHLATRVDYIEEHTQYVEEQLRDVAIDHNEFLDAHDINAEEIHKLQLKVGDLEDRPRQNNVKF